MPKRRACNCCYLSKHKPGYGMHILWCSNYSSQSGYAIQARLIVPRLIAAGHRVTVLELANGSRLPAEIEGVTIMPVGLDPLGADTLVDHYRRSGAHATLTLVDAWGLRPDIMRQVNWYPLTPIDTQPIAPAVLDSLKACQRPIAYSLYGYAELQKVGLNPLYWPHGVDPAVWQPLDKQVARARLGIPPQIFFASFVGVNDSVAPNRKGIPELLMAWQLFSAQHTGVKLYLHTSVHGNLPISSTGGVQIDRIIQTLGIDPHTIQLVDQFRYRTGIPATELATIAAASDVLVLPSTGEGFGLPLLEFQRVGCPVITTNFAAGAELCFSGWLLEGEPCWSWQSALVMKPGVTSIVEALEAAYADRDNPQRRHVAIERARDYDIDTLTAKYALPVLREIAEESLDRLQVA